MHNGGVTVSFERRTVINAPVGVVFELSLDVDVHLQSQARSGERAIAGVTRGTIGLGEQVTWRATHFGIPFKMTSKVTELDRPNRFVDEQVRGPFHRFHHEHCFHQQGAETEMIDRVEFVAPLGAVGRLVERFVLAGYLRKLIEERGAFLKQQAEKRSAG